MTYALKPDSPADDNRPALAKDLSPGAALEAFRQRLVRLAVKLVWNRDDAEEIVQEAFKVAISKRVNFTEDRFGPWMFRTVTHLAMNRRRARRPEPIADWMEPADTADPARSAAEAERLTALRAAIGELPDQQRLAIVLRTIEGLGYETIAEIMELSTAAVRTHVHLGRRKLVATMTGSRKTS